MMKEIKEKKLQSSKQILEVGIPDEVRVSRFIKNNYNKNIPIEELMDLTQLEIKESDIKNKFLIPVLTKICKIDKTNRLNGSNNYIGSTWLKNQLQSKNFLQVNGEGFSFSGNNVSILLDFLINNGYIYNITDDKIAKIVPNYNNEKIKEIESKI